MSPRGRISSGTDLGGAAAKLGPDGTGLTGEDAEECFHKAIARQHHAKALELRVVVNLSWLWQRQGKQKEAHQLLTESYSWFTEGFGTKDLQDAKAL